jgi:hypothetical protein
VNQSAGEVSNRESHKTNRKKTTPSLGPTLLAVLIVFVLALGALLISSSIGSGKSASVGSSELRNIQLYRLDEEPDTRSKTTAFSVSDVIEIGFEYDTSDGKDMVRFLVTSRDNNEVVFTSNLYRLTMERDEMFLNLSKPGLTEGDYIVSIRDINDAELYSQKFTLED